MMPVSTRLALGDASLLVALCRRGAEERLDPRRLAGLGGSAERASLYELAARHGVAGLVFSVLRFVAARSRPRPAWAREVELRDRALRKRAALLQIKRDRVLATMHRAGLRPVVLKGGALAGDIYHEAHHRDLMDLDLLVPSDLLERGSHALEAVGYRTACSPAKLQTYLRHHFHVPFVEPGGHCVELHWDLGPQDSSFRLTSESVIEQAIPLRDSDDGRSDLLAPRPEHMLLHLVLQNLQEGFSRLSRFVDVDRIIVANRGLDWDGLTADACSGKLAASAAVTLQICRRIFGTPVPDIVVARLAPSPLARVHLAAMRPCRTVLQQQMVGRWTARALLRFWLTADARGRLRQLREVCHPGPFAVDFEGRRRGTWRGLLAVGKLVVSQLTLSGSLPLALATPGGRAQMRFWSSHASNSERL